MKLFRVWPFPATSLAVLAKAVCSEPPPQLDRVNPAVTSATAALVARCLAKKPEDRHADAGLFLRAVESILAGETTEVAAHPWHPPARAARSNTFIRGN